MAFRAASRLHMADDYDRLFLAAQGEAVIKRMRRDGGARAGKYWRFGGKTFETAEQVVEYAKNPS